MPENCFNYLFFNVFYHPLKNSFQTSSSSSFFTCSHVYFSLHQLWPFLKWTTISLHFNQHLQWVEYYFTWEKRSIYVCYLMLHIFKKKTYYYRIEDWELLSHKRISFRENWWFLGSSMAQTVVVIHCFGHEFAIWMS